MDGGACPVSTLVACWSLGAAAMANTPDFEYDLIDSTTSKVQADATGAKGG